MNGTHLRCFQWPVVCHGAAGRKTQQGGGASAKPSHRRPEPPHPPPHTQQVQTPVLSPPRHSFPPSAQWCRSPPPLANADLLLKAKTGRSFLPWNCNDSGAEARG